jgi:hypothetical protein
MVDIASFPETPIYEHTLFTIRPGIFEVRKYIRWDRSHSISLQLLRYVFSSSFIWLRFCVQGHKLTIQVLLLSDAIACKLSEFPELVGTINDIKMEGLKAKYEVFPPIEACLGRNTSLRKPNKSVWMALYRWNMYTKTESALPSANQLAAVWLELTDQEDEHRRAKVNSYHNQIHSLPL